MRILSLVRPATSLALASSSSRSRASFSHSLPQQQRPPFDYSMHTSFSQHDIIDRYDAFILDQFGVLHNGVAALEGAVELCEHLHKKQKKLIILSNTSAPSDRALAKLPKLGFQSYLFVDAVTSGEESSRYIKKTYGNNAAKPSKALMFTWNVARPNNPRLTATPEAYLEQCGHVRVAKSVDEADFVLLHGSEVWYRGDDKAEESTCLGSFIDQGGWEVIDPLLEQCRRRKLPMVCANPDLIVQTPTGGTAHMPGQIAQRYQQQMKGECTSFGKPAAKHFEACLEKLQLEDSRGRVAHVGDSLHHDIAGATAAGIPTVFVTSGIHAQQLRTPFGELPPRDRLEGLFQEEGSIVPTHVVSAFRL